MRQLIEEIISNRKAKETVHWIRKKGTISKHEMKELTGLASSTLTRILDELVGSGMIEEIGYGESTGGRRPVLYRVHPTCAYVFGLDISRVFSRIVLCDMHLNIVDSQIWKMDHSMTPDRLLKETAQTVRRMLSEHGIDEASVLGLGVGAVGPLDRFTGMMLTPSSFPSPGWNDIAVVAMLEQELGMPVVLDNGANAALVAEYWLDAVNQYDHLLYIHAGVGLRSAMMSSGNVVYGAVDMEGAVGQMIIQTDGLSPRDRGGNYGSWESYASIYALEQAAISALKQGRSSVLEQMVKSPEQVTFAKLERALAMKDSLVQQLFAQSAVYFGIGLANLLNILHPEKVILGGPLISGQTMFFQLATQTAIKKTYHYPNYQVVFGKSKLADDAVAVGAAVMVINRLTE